MEFNLTEANGDWTIQEIDDIFYSADPGLPFQRMSHAASALEILQGKYDIYIPVWLPVKFAEFVEDRIASAVRESGIQGYATPVFAQISRKICAGKFGQDPELCPVMWRVTNMTMWQKLHRTIDEYVIPPRAQRRAFNNTHGTVSGFTR